VETTLSGKAQGSEVFSGAQLCLGDPQRSCLISEVLWCFLVPQAFLSRTWVKVAALLMHCWAPSISEAPVHAGRRKEVTLLSAEDLADPVSHRKGWRRRGRRRWHDLLWAGCGQWMIREGEAFLWLRTNFLFRMEKPLFFFSHQYWWRAGWLDCSKGWGIILHIACARSSALLHLISRHCRALMFPCPHSAPSH